MITVFTDAGVVLHQNAQSRRYLGERTACTGREDVLLAVFSLDPDKRTRMAEELSRPGGLWKAVVRVPPSLRCSQLDLCRASTSNAGGEAGKLEAPEATDGDRVLSGVHSRPPPEADSWVTHGGPAASEGDPQSLRTLPPSPLPVDRKIVNAAFATVTAAPRKPRVGHMLLKRASTVLGMARGPVQSQGPRLAQSQGLGQQACLRGTRRVSSFTLLPAAGVGGVGEIGLESEAHEDLLRADESVVDSTCMQSNPSGTFFQDPLATSTFATFAETAPPPIVGAAASHPRAVPAPIVPTGRGCTRGGGSPAASPIARTTWRRCNSTMHGFALLGDAPLPSSRSFYAAANGSRRHLLHAPMSPRTPHTGSQGYPHTGSRALAFAMSLGTSPLTQAVAMWPPPQHSCYESSDNLEPWGSLVAGPPPADSGSKGSVSSAAAAAASDGNASGATAGIRATSPGLLPIARRSRLGAASFSVHHHQPPACASRLRSASTSANLRLALPKGAQALPPPAAVASQPVPVRGRAAPIWSTGGQVDRYSVDYSGGATAGSSQQDVTPGHGASLSRAMTSAHNTEDAMHGHFQPIHNAEAGFPGGSAAGRAATTGGFFWPVPETEEGVDYGNATADRVQFVGANSTGGAGPVQGRGRRAVAAAIAAGVKAAFGGEGKSRRGSSPTITHVNPMCTVPTAPAQDVPQSHTGRNAQEQDEALMASPFSTSLYADANPSTAPHNTAPSAASHGLPALCGKGPQPEPLPPIAASASALAASSSSRYNAAAPTSLSLPCARAPSGAGWKHYDNLSAIAAAADTDADGATTAAGPVAAAAADSTGGGDSVTPGNLPCGELRVHRMGSIAEATAHLELEVVASEAAAVERPEPECWHEIWATRARDPVTGQDAIIVTQMDVTAKVIAERHLALVMESEHRLVEQLFPRHILQHITEEWTAAADAGGPAPLPRAGAGAVGSGAAGSGGGGRRPAVKGSERWQPVLRNCSALATLHPEVTLLFADIKGFTPACKELEPRQVMTMLNALYSRYDAMLDQYGVYKVETIGDCYFVAGGLIREDEDGMAAVREGGSGEDPLHAERVFEFAKAMLRAAREVAMPHTGQPVEIRIGIHTGPVVSGVVGTRMPRFCLFGDTVNTASRMESTSTPGAIHVSEETFRRLPRSNQWEPTGGIEVKGKGLMKTYLWRSNQALPPLGSIYVARGSAGGSGIAHKSARDAPVLSPAGSAEQAGLQARLATKVVDVAATMQGSSGGRDVGDVTLEGFLVSRKDDSSVVLPVPTSFDRRGLLPTGLCQG